MQNIQACPEIEGWQARQQKQVEWIALKEWWKAVKTGEQAQMDKVQEMYGEELSRARDAWHEAQLIKARGHMVAECWKRWWVLWNMGKRIKEARHDH